MEYRDLYINPLWACRVETLNVIPNEDYCIQLRTSFLDSDYKNRDLAFERCLNKHLTGTETEQTCGLRFYKRKDYMQKYDCLANIGVERGIDFCYDDFIYGIKPGKS